MPFKSKLQTMWLFEEQSKFIFQNERHFKSSYSIIHDWQVKIMAPLILTPLITSDRLHWRHLRQVFLAKHWITGLLWKRGISPATAKVAVCARAHSTVRPRPPHQRAQLLCKVPSEWEVVGRDVFVDMISHTSHSWEQAQRWTLFTAPVKCMNFSMLVERVTPNILLLILVKLCKIPEVV